MARADGGATPTFSVLIAAYNQGDYLRATLDSVAAQTSRDFEVVVVNDGSTDHSGAVAAEWASQFQPGHRFAIQVAEIPNSGQSAALEHGFTLCSGRYVCLLDSDDLWLPTKLETLARAVQQSPDAGMLVHPLYVIDDQGRRTGDVRPKRAKLSSGDLREQVRHTTRLVAPATSGMTLRADVLARLVPMPIKRFRTAADFYLALGAALLEPVLALDEPLAEYRMHPSGQHIRTMLSPDGLRRWVELQAVMVNHFGLQRAAERNSYFLRHEFALAKLEGDSPRQVSAYRKLLRATWSDPGFGARDKAMFTAYWSACLLAPRAGFRRLWRTFQLKQTGFDRIGLAATAESVI